MLRLLKFSWLAIVIGGGTVLAVMALLADDPGGAAVLGGIALVIGLAVMLVSGEPRRRKSRGFEPHRKR